MKETVYAFVAFSIPLEKLRKSSSLFIQYNTCLFFFLLLQILLYSLLNSFTCNGVERALVYEEERYWQSKRRILRFFPLFSSQEDSSSGKIRLSEYLKTLGGFVIVMMMMNLYVCLDSGCGFATDYGGRGNRFGDARDRCWRNWGFACEWWKSNCSV